MKTLARSAPLELLALVLSLAAVPSAAYSAPNIVIEPISSFTARRIGGNNVLVGASSGTEGTAWRSTFLDIKEGTSDRTILEYDLGGKPLAASAILNLELTNLDVPKYTTIFVYSFDGNGLANAADYFRTDNFVTTFTDFGLASNFIPPYHIPYTFDLTAIYNQAISQGDGYLGILIKNTTAEAQYARYRLTTFNGLPKLTVTVPEPNTVVLLAVVVSMLLPVRRIANRPQISPTNCEIRWVG